MPDAICTRAYVLVQSPGSRRVPHFLCFHKGLGFGEVVRDATDGCSVQVAGKLSMFRPSPETSPSPEASAAVACDLAATCEHHIQQLSQIEFHILLTRSPFKRALGEQNVELMWP